MWLNNKSIYVFCFFLKRGVGDEGVLNAQFSESIESNTQPWWSIMKNVIEKCE